MYFNSVVTEDRNPSTRTVPRPQPNEASRDSGDVGTVHDLMSRKEVEQSQKMEALAQLTRGNAAAAEIGVSFQRLMAHSVVPFQGNRPHTPRLLGNRP